MKKTIKVLAAVMMLVAAVLCTACSNAIDVSKIKGDWTTSTINGQTPAEYAAALGITENMAATNITIDDTKVTVTNALDSKSFTYTKGSNGIEAKENGELVLSLVYDDTAKTLSMQVGTDADAVKFVFTKGTYDFAAASAPAESIAE